MSLDQDETATTRQELQSNLTLSGLSPQDLMTALKLDETRLNAALQMSRARPEDVWLVRDYLDHVIRAAGRIPMPYSSLTEDMRAAAQVWFPLSNVHDVIGETS